MDELIHKLYIEWCKETKRNGAILVGGSIRQFFDWLTDKGYKLSKDKKPNPNDNVSY